MKRMMGRKTAFVAVAVLLLAAGTLVLYGFRDNDSDYFLKINKSIDIFGRVYREVTMNYVENIDPQKFMESGIDGLLGTLDPYTNFINETEGDEVELITSGKYGGVGVTIGLRDGKITILTVMEGYSAQRQGIQPGDRILSIDGSALDGLKPDNVRALTRGEPGSEVRLKIERDGEPKPLDFVLVREEIQLHNISYAGYLDSGIGYARIDRFSRGAGDELRLAIKNMRLKGELKGFVLDLRDNPGGLLDVAVDVVEKFAPKGSLVVTTRGRRSENDKQFFVTEEPLIPDVPLVVLVNRNSASASEIVAGAIQDLDRGVILGTRTFGKGLVQTITPLGYNTQLKITTAKYYTPSGRCIQEIDYQHRNGNGVFVATPDSLRRTFKTAGGRKVLELGGIQPDSVIGEQLHSTIYAELLRKSLFLRFAGKTAHEFPALPSWSDDTLLLRFRAFLDGQHFAYQSESEGKLKDLRDAVASSKNSEAILADLDNVGKMLETLKGDDFHLHGSELLRALRIELSGRYKGEEGRIEASFEHDTQLLAAKGLLLNSKEYRRRLHAN
ncbi:MAG TPA: S41 family peptidase [Bacteroidota bacterium]|nr:S41 family peptidase [Bacteroidota bacterium]